jgi:NAD(P) transhydrogenase
MLDQPTPEITGQSTTGEGHDFDLIVMGSGPAGQRAAIQAAKLGKRAAIIERRTVIGGGCINTGTIPSKTLREAAMHLSGYRERNVYGASYVVKHDIAMSDLLFRADHVIRNEIDVTHHQLRRNGVVVIEATATFADANTVRLDYFDGRGQRAVTADRIVIAVGTETTKSPDIPFDGQTVFTSDDILDLEELPRTLVVIGAGVIGLEYATIFATLGVRVTLRLGEGVESITREDSKCGPHVRVVLDNGKQIVASKALYSVGRTGATRELNLAAAGLEADERGRLTVDANYRTSVSSIYAAGDVIGFPSLASTSMEQGRLAACHAFDASVSGVAQLFPYGIYTIPEISVVGANEEELTAKGVPYEVGKSFYREISRGQIIGDSTGLLKILFHIETREILGVSILGEGASELIHIGQAVMAHSGTIDYFVDTVFNYPTLAECYKTAAFDGLNRLE